jgi:hypothetical protein
MSIELLLNVVKRRFSKLLSLKAQYCLFSHKKAQKNEFMRLRSCFLPIYDKLEKQNISNFITDLWQNNIEELKKVFLPEPPFDFLRNKTIRGTMFVDSGGKWLIKELSLLETTLTTAALQELLEEDYVGKPNFLNSRYLTSHNTVHHLYHIINFQEKTGIKINEYDSLVEWGGGYGNMAKIVHRIHNTATYTIIDLPLFSCIQWIYLSTILGEEQVNIIAEPNNNIIRGKINILPLSFINEQRIKSDIFIATWSLSESSRFAQDYVESTNFFDSRHILLAFQKSSRLLPDADYLGEIAKKRKLNIEAIDFLPNNYYAFC